MHREQVEEGLLFLGKVGSVAYGTNLPGSDVDLKGVCIPPLNYFFGTKFFEQKDSWGTETGNIPELDLSQDKVVYSLTKYVQLVQAQNPNILDLLWLPEDCILRTSDIFDNLVLNRKKLLSKAAYNSFGGYAEAQLKRMENHRKWLIAEAKGEAQKRPELRNYVPESLAVETMITKDELYAYYEFLVSLLKDRTQYFAQYPEFVSFVHKIDWKGLIKQEGLSAEQAEYSQSITGATDNYIHLLHSTQNYMADLRRYEAWKSWKTNRNVERATLELKCGYDGKNAAHCLRLQTMAVEILTTQEVKVRRVEDADFLKQVRQGNISYEEVMTLCASLKEQAKAAYATTSLPARVDSSWIDDWLYTTLDMYFYLE